MKRAFFKRTNVMKTRVCILFALLTIIALGCNKPNEPNNGGNNNGGNEGNALNGHEYVDLGLPSGVLWATCNVGAAKPEEYGDYIAWGETAPKPTYNWRFYRYCNDNNTSLTKYCSNPRFGYNGFIDTLTTLQSIDDAATVNWGAEWRMPTKAEWEELKNNTTSTWTLQGEVFGRKFNALNGNSIFIPAAGACNDSSLEYAGDCGGYWSSSLDTNSPCNASYFYFDPSDCFLHNGMRRSGSSVRPVCSKK